MKIHPTEDLAAYAIGALDRPEAAVVEAHLTGCETCRAEVASFADVAWGIAELAPAVTPPAGVREAVMRVPSRPRSKDRETATARRSPLSSLFAFRVPIAVPLALVLLLAASLAGLGTARSDADTYARAIAGIADGTVLTLTATPGSEARGSLVVPATGEPYLILRLPPPPEGKTWEAWVIRGQQPLAAGLTDRSGVVTLVLGHRVSSGDAVAVTLEDAGGVPVPRGPVVLQGRI